MDARCGGCRSCASARGVRLPTSVALARTPLHRGDVSQRHSHDLSSTDHAVRNEYGSRLCLPAAREAAAVDLVPCSRGVVTATWVLMVIPLHVSAALAAESLPWAPTDVTSAGGHGVTGHGDIERSLVCEQ